MTIDWRPISEVPKDGKLVPDLAGVGRSYWIEGGTVHSCALPRRAA